MLEGFWKWLLGRPPAADTDFLWSYSGDVSERSSAPNIWPNWPKGTLEHSRQLREVKLYRYQPKAHTDLTDTWYHMIWDVQRKWDAKDRFSGQHISPGHYFSLSKGGADAELAHYKGDPAGRELLVYTVTIDNLLDLTSMEALKWFHTRHFNTAQDWHWAVILDSLFDQQSGGDVHNSFAGHKAILDNYTGIIYFGARACAEYWDEPGSMKERDWDLIGFPHMAMMEDDACVNVAIYFGHNVVQATRQIECGGQTVANSLFGASYDRISEVFMADPSRPPDEDLTFESERTRAERIAWISSPGIVEENWRPEEKGEPREKDDP